MDSWSAAQAATAAAAAAGNEMDCESDGAEARVVPPRREVGDGWKKNQDLSEEAIKANLNLFSFARIWSPEHNTRRHRDLTRGFACNMAKCNANAC